GLGDRVLGDETVQDGLQGALRCVLVALGRRRPADRGLARAGERLEARAGHPTDERRREGPARRGQRPPVTWHLYLLERDPAVVPVNAAAVSGVPPGAVSMRGSYELLTISEWLPLHIRRVRRRRA